MASFSKVSIIGKVGRDPELKSVGNNNYQVAEFSVAVTTKRGGNEKTDWYRISFWNKQAEVIQQYVKRGDSIYVEGRLNVREYTDKDGNARFSLDVEGREFTLLGRRQIEGESNNTPAPAPQAAAPQPTSTPVSPDLASNSNEADDLPF